MDDWKWIETQSHSYDEFTLRNFFNMWFWTSIITPTKSTEYHNEPATNGTMMNGKFYFSKCQWLYPQIPSPSYHQPRQRYTKLQRNLQIWTPMQAMAMKKRRHDLDRPKQTKWVSRSNQALLKRESLYLSLGLDGTRLDQKSSLAKGHELHVLLFMFQRKSYWFVHTNIETSIDSKFQMKT